jgi:hypothetical protein
MASYKFRIASYHGVVAGLDPAIHLLAKSWMPGSIGSRSDAVFDGYARA